MRPNRTLATSIAAVVALAVLAVPTTSEAGRRPVLTVDPASGPPGTVVSISGFASNECVVSPPGAPLPRILGVVVRFSQGGSVPDVISGPGPTAEAGATISADALPGPATLSVYCWEEEVDSTLREDFLDDIDFTVTSAPSPTSSSSTTTSVPDTPSAQPRFTG